MFKAPRCTVMFHYRSNYRNIANIFLILQDRNFIAALLLLTAIEFYFKNELYYLSLSKSWWILVLVESRIFCHLIHEHHSKWGISLGTMKQNMKLVIGFHNHVKHYLRLVNWKFVVMDPWYRKYSSSCSSKSNSEPLSRIFFCFSKLSLVWHR